MSYENGKPAIIPPLEQYYFVSDNLSFIIVVQGYSENSLSFSMNNQNHQTLNYTGKIENDKKLQIYDTSENEFKLRWFNTHMPNSNIFPYYDYTIETYSKESIPNRMIKAFDLLKGNYDSYGNKFLGCWKRRGMTDSELDISHVYDAPSMYKICSRNYGIQLSSVSAAKNSEYAHCVTFGFYYHDDNNITEKWPTVSNHCSINWINDSTYTLSFFEGGQRKIEVWDKCGLPEAFQKAFGTNIPIVNPNQ